MALVTFQDLPNTTTPLNASNLNNNFNEVGADSGWVTLNSVIKYRKVGQWVCVVGNSAAAVTLTPGSYTVVGTLPEGYRPSIVTGFTAHYQGGSVSGQSNYIDNSGKIQMFIPSSSSPYLNYWQFTVTYPV